MLTWMWLAEWIGTNANHNEALLYSRRAHRVGLTNRKSAADPTILRKWDCMINLIVMNLPETLQTCFMMFGMFYAYFFGQNNDRKPTWI